MPIYSYFCEKCKKGFEVYKHRDKASELEKCPKCSKISDRDWASDNVYMKDPPKTLGSLADKNADKISNDQKEKILARNRRKPTKNQYNPEKKNEN